MEKLTLILCLCGEDSTVTSLCPAHMVRATSWTTGSHIPGKGNVRLDKLCGKLGQIFIRHIFEESDNRLGAVLEESSHYEKLDDE